MKPFFLILLFVLGVFIISGCEKSSDEKTLTDFLADKYIRNIKIVNDTLWISSYSQCDTCPAVHGSLPWVSQLTMSIGNEYVFSVQDQSVFPLVSGPDGRLYTATDNAIKRIISYDQLQTVLETGTFDFDFFALDDENNIWLSGSNGIAFWNKTNLTIHNESTDGTPDITHGLYVDGETIWIPLNFNEGLLKIVNGTWNIIDYSQVPKLTDVSYLINPLKDNSDNMWFTVYRSDTTSNFIRNDGVNWKYELPNDNGAGFALLDSQGDFWVIFNKFLDSEFKGTYISTYVNGAWVKYDVSSIKKIVTTLDTDDQYIYLGTTSGMHKISR